MEHNGLLVLSSAGFSIPACYAFYKKQYTFAILSFVTSCVSIAFWIHPVDGFRRDLDLIMSKVSFSIYFVSAISNYCNQRETYYIPLFIGTPSMICLYTMSCANMYPWWLYHFIFHLLVILHKLLTIQLVLLLPNLNSTNRS